MARKSNITKIPQTHKITNWSHYNNSLKQRGSLELWRSKDIEDIWYEENRVNHGTGNPRKYTDESVKLAYAAKLCFKQPLCGVYQFII